MARHEVEFLWFRDCANHAAVLQMLEDVIGEFAPGTPIKSIDATDPAVATAHRFPGSPTIRIDGRDVDPSFQDPPTTRPAAGSTGRRPVRGVSLIDLGSRPRSAARMA